MDMCIYVLRRIYILSHYYQYGINLVAFDFITFKAGQNDITN